MEIEEWEDVEGYEGRYKISNTGVIWDHKRNREVSQFLSGIPQYYYINLSKSDKTRKMERVHRLIAKAFIEQPYGCDFVDHIDRNKLNNQISNLRWVDRSGNQRNLSKNIYHGDILLSDYCNKYENPQAAYSYILRYKNQYNLEIDGCILKYESFLEEGLPERLISWRGESYKVSVLCGKLNLDKNLINRRLRDGWNEWNAIVGLSPSIQNTGISIKSNNLISYWFPSTEYFCSMYNKPVEISRKMIAEGCTLEEVVGYKYQKPSEIHTVRGITGNLKELCDHFKVSLNLISTRLYRYGMSIEEAFTVKPMKIKSLSIDGIRKSPADWCRVYGIDPKKFNKIRSSKKTNFKSTFMLMGIDLTDSVFSPEG